MTIEIKKYDPAHLDAMMIVWRAATTIAHPFQGEAELDRDENMIRIEFIQMAETWTAWLDSKLIGFITLMGTTVVALFVDPNLQRSGVGSALMAHANQLHGPLSVEVFVENAIGMPFYKKHGFKKIREEEMAYYPGHQQLIMAQDGADVPEGDPRG